MSISFCSGLMRLIPLRDDRSGATAIEYALIAALISLMVVGWASSIGSTVCGFFMSAANGL